MRRRALAGGLITVLGAVGAAMAAPGHAESAACAVSVPNHNTPPDAVLARAGMYRARGATTSGDTTFGNGQIWTDLWPNGVIVFRKGGAGFILPDGSLKMKFLWLLAGDGPLTITGRRLDAEAPPLTADLSTQFTGAGFQPSYLIFPTAGCWEVKASANGSTLTIVTSVATDGF